MKNPNEPMTKAQRHIIFNKRLSPKVGGYTRAELKQFISDKFNVAFEDVDLQKLTKLQAQMIIMNFKPHKKVVKPINNETKSEQ